MPLRDSLPSSATHSAVETLRHRRLRRLAHIGLRAPGAKASVRRLLRLVIQHSSLSLKNRQRLYNFFAFATAPARPVTCTVRTPRGARLHWSLHLDDWISSQLYFWGYTNYELPVTRLFDELLDRARCVIDVGANIGYYTLLAASRLPRGAVHAFEPWPTLFARLETACRSNGFHHVVLNQAAVSDRDGVTRLYLPTTSATDAHLSNASLVEGFAASNRHIEVTTLRLDTYVARRGLRHLDLVKVDAEGAELAVLRGLGQLLFELKPDLILEVLEPYVEELERFFAETRYAKFLITDDGLQAVDSLKAHPTFRDYYLTHRSDSHDAARRV